MAGSAILTRGASRLTDPSSNAPDPILTNMEKIKIEHHTFSGLLWFVGWLFTIGFVQLSFWKGVLAIVVWPYYLGVAVKLLIHQS
jgi:uncharacterized membrane protein